MRVLFFIQFFLIAFTSLSQNCVYDEKTGLYYKNGIPCNDTEKIKTDSTGVTYIICSKGIKVKELRFSPKGKLYSETHFRDKDPVDIAYHLGIHNEEDTINYFYETGIRTMEEPITNGQVNGIMRGWYENGIKEWEAEFHNGYLNGLRKDWYSDGNEMREGSFYGNFANEIPNGKVTCWYENKMKSSEIVYDSGRIMNVNLLQDKDGHPLNYGSLKDGNGTLIEYWFEINSSVDFSTIESIGEYKNGLLDGEYVMFDEGSTSDTNTIMHYKNGNEDGIYVQFQANNKKLLEGYKKNGIYEGIVKMWDEKGREEMEEVYKNGIMVKQEMVSPGYSVVDKKKNIELIKGFISALLKIKDSNYDGLVKEYFEAESMRRYFFYKTTSSNDILKLRFANIIYSVPKDIRPDQYKVIQYSDAEKQKVKDLLPIRYVEGYGYGSCSSPPVLGLKKNIYVVVFTFEGKQVNGYILMENNKIKSIHPCEQQTIYSNSTMGPPCWINSWNIDEF